MKKRINGTLWTLGILTLLAIGGLPLLGRTLYSPALWTASADDRAEAESNRAMILWRERAPKTLLAMIAGSGLALAGMALQALFRNPLASPFTLGTASGAAFGATLYQFIAGTGVIASAPFLGFPPITLASLAGSALATGVVFALSRSRDISSEQMLLAGIAVSFFFSSLILALQYISDVGRSFRMIRWTMGGIDALEGGRLIAIFSTVLIAAGLLFFFSRELDILLTGEERALSLGVNVGRFRVFLFFLSSILVGVIVSVCGPIGFVGLMVPHLCRLMVGSEHRTLVPATALLGALFLGGCFTVSRTILRADILPVGIITSLLGGPFFLWLLLGRREKTY